VNALKICPQCGTEYPANARFCEIDGTALRSAAGSSDLVGSIVAERYHVLKKLGEGGMGQVYLAEHVKMGRKSALKVMHPGMVKDVDAISRFNREASNAARISHPNVAAIYDFGESTDGVIYLAMEFVDGVPLTKVIEQAGSLPAQRVAEIVRQTGDALAVAHDMGIVHRDLKPDNIMVAKTRDGGDLVKVVDFGIAKAAGNEAQKVTKTGLVVGTPEYMSPEQLAGDQLDGRSDIYALALVTFNMLTGKLPFPAETTQESMIMRLTDRPKTLAEMRPDVAWPADVQAVMDRALERDAAKRYQTAAEFGRDLHRAITRMPETAAAAMGTELLDVPPTRVAPPAPDAVPLPTQAQVPMTAPPRSAPVPSSIPPKRSRMPLIAGLSTIVIVAAGTFAVLKFRPEAKPAAAADTATAPAVGTAPVVIPQSTTPDTVSRTAENTTQFAAQKPTPSAANDDTTANPPTPAGRAANFDRLDRLAAETATADRALKQVERVRIVNDEDRVRAAFVKFKAQLNLGHADEACDALRPVAAIAPKTSKANLVAGNLAACP
jgi:serine/threonine-protein kinase